jgi:SynChlorMet cassette radical SAM/SPASM protein ScmF
MDKPITQKEQDFQIPNGIPLLSQYYVYLTEGCNLACQHCWISPQYQANGGTGGHLKFELLKQAVEEGIPLGLQSVKLTGGEPLLHPDFLRIVDFIKEKQLRLTIETNGILMTPELARYLKEKSTLYHISLSLDGARAETHEALRGVKGSYQKTVNALHMLVNEDIHPQIIMSLHTGNRDEIEPLVHMAEEMGCNSVKFNLIMPSGRGEIMKKRGRVMNIQELVEVGNWIEEDLQKRVDIMLSYSWPIAFHGLKRLLNRGPDGCGIFQILGILGNGGIALCGIGMEIPELCFGTIGVDSICDIWYKNSILCDLRTKLPNELEGVCAECILRTQCLGSCVAENYHDAKKLTAPFWFCQQAYENGLFPLNRLQNNIKEFS